MTPALAFAQRHWKPILAGLIALTLIIRGDYYRIDRNHWRSVAQVLRIDLDAIKAAQESAARLAEAKKRQEQAVYSQLAERADHAERQADRYRTAAARYASTHRVRAEAPRSASSGTSGAGTPGAAESDQRSGGDAGVVVSRTDFDTLVGNTIRLKAAHDWGEDLVAAGLAVKGS